MPSRTPLLAPALVPKELAEALRDAYKKHAAELLAIEESRLKVTLVFLGVFGAGASFLASAKSPLDPRVNWALTVVVIAIFGLAAGYTYECNRARRAVRGLLVACEETLGFFEPNKYYLATDALYPLGCLSYPGRGAWLGWLSFAVVLLGGIGFLLVLWYRGA
jgi:hypothetical protein